MLGLLELVLISLSPTNPQGTSSQKYNRLGEKRRENRKGVGDTKGEKSFLKKRRKRKKKEKLSNWKTA